MRVLYVCTANICRSPSAAYLLGDALGAVPEEPDVPCDGLGPAPAAPDVPRGGPAPVPGAHVPRGEPAPVPGAVEVQVRSAGTAALGGLPGCDLAPALRGGRADGHASRPLTPELVRWADLILTAEREHRSVVVTMEPSARRRTFTILQAGRISAWMVDIGIVDAAVTRASGAGGGGFDPADPRAEVEAMPAAGEKRWGWLVSELDAARGVAVARAGVDVAAEEASAQRGPSRLWTRRSRELVHRREWTAHPDDVPDPHVLGVELHGSAYEQIKRGTEALARLMMRTARA